MAVSAPAMAWTAPSTPTYRKRSNRREKARSCETATTAPRKPSDAVATRSTSVAVASLTDTSLTDTPNRLPLERVVAPPRVQTVSGAGPERRGPGRDSNQPCGYARHRHACSRLRTSVDGAAHPGLFRRAAGSSSYARMRLQGRVEVTELGRRPLTIAAVAAMGLLLVLALWVGWGGGPASPRIVEGWATPNAAGTAISLHDSRDGGPGEGYVAAGARWQGVDGAQHDGAELPTRIGTDTASSIHVRLGLVTVESPDGARWDQVSWFGCWE